MDTGIARARLGEAAAAEPLIAAALRREPDNHRGRAVHGFWLAITQLRRGNVDQACDAATQALGTAAVVGSERITGHLREFHQRLCPGQRGARGLGLRGAATGCPALSVSEWLRP
ncbi:hypothetical protein AB0F42_01925 [Streptomyces buecherae]|uniref:hypothetical protein n=1 Tax=Streptomyces buecherae TaxID=2763006 RepID=UPI0033EA4782